MVDARIDADAMVFQTEKALEEVGDKLDAGLKGQVEADLNTLKETISSTANLDTLSDDQIQQLKDGKENLMKSAQALFAKMYEQTQGATGPDMNCGDCGGDCSGGCGPEDDVVDADYKEV